jgi:subtilisin family serine protease
MFAWPGLAAAAGVAGVAEEVIQGRRPRGGSDIWRVRLTEHEALGVIADRAGAVTWSTVRGDVRHVIVEIAGTPLAKLGHVKASAAAREEQRMRRELARVAADVTALEGAARQANGSAPGDVRPIIRREYVRVLVGLAAAVSPETVARLEQLPGVVRVSPVVRVTAFLRESVPLIRADRVWGSLAATGRGVTVAIVDTGVSYGHPDLGGCLGPSCKVVGGYDFVNDDPDPADDNGHGTHVAGIVGANGGIRGVAPDVSLLAYKVLDETGSGSTADVIAGIERAVADGARVINLSLGGPGHPNDPTSRAVDNAAAAGLVVCVAAGNEGSRYETVASPGVARAAVTVGASAKDDTVAAFSARGPAQLTWHVKPNVIAPGVAVTSTVPTGTCPLCDPSGYRSMDGTSMAASHVAGAAALILSRFPSWAPAQVKAALTQRAISVGADVFTEGSGRLDALFAATAALWGSRIGLSFGLDEPGPSRFSRAIDVDVTNRSTTTQQAEMSIDANVPAGMHVTLSARSLSLAPRERRTVRVRLAIDNTTVPNVRAAPYAYEGVLLVRTAQGQRLRFPFAVLKTPVLQVAFDEAPWLVTVNDADELAKYAWFPGLACPLLVPEGTWDLVVLYQDGMTRVLRERIPVTTRTEVAVTRAEAALRVRIDPVKPGQEPLDPQRTMWRSIFKPRSGVYTQTVRCVGGCATLPEFAFSTASARYRFEATLAEDRTAIGGPSSVFHGYFKAGLTESVVFRNRPADLRRIEVEHHTDPGQQDVWIATFLRGPAWWKSAYCYFADPPLRAPVREVVYFMPQPYDDYELGHLQKFVARRRDRCEMPSDSSLMYVSGDFAVRPSRALEVTVPATNTALLATGSTALALGLGPYRWFGDFVNDASEIRIRATRDDFLWGLFLAQAGDLRPHDPLAYELYHGSSLVERGSLEVGRWWWSPAMLTVSLPAPGRYRLRIRSHQFYVGARQGNGDVTATFDTSGDDRNPPALDGFALLGADRRTDTLRRDATTRLRFSFADDAGPPAIAAYLRVDGGWGEIPVRVIASGARSTGIADVEVPSGAGTQLRLRLTAVDAAGNQLSYETNLAVAP